MGFNIIPPPQIMFNLLMLRPPPTHTDYNILLCPSSGARDYNVDYHIGRFVLGLLNFTFI